MDNNQNNNNYYQQPDNQNPYENSYQQPYSQPSYSQPSYNNGAPVSSGLSLASMICGIVGFVTGPAASIAALIMSNMYKNKNNGQHCSQSKTGFTCGLISLILWGVLILFYIAIYCFIIVAAMGNA